MSLKMCVHAHVSLRALWSATSLPLGCLLSCPLVALLAAHLLAPFLPCLLSSLIDLKLVR